MATLADTIRDKIDAGVLPCERPAKALAARGDGSPCTGCDLPILPTQFEWSFWSGTVVTYRLHFDCHGLWETECRERGWQIASR